MATHGSLSNLTFEPNKEDWSSYVLRLKYYFKANRVTESDEKKSILLTAVGPATFRRIGSLLTMARLDSIGYDGLVKEVADFYDPKPSSIVQRFRFNTRQRASNESIATYVAALRRLAEHCNFSDLNEMLRDRLVCGVNHDTIQTRLLAEKELTFQKALDLSQAVEAAEKNSKLLQNSKPAESQSDQGKLNYTKRGQKTSSSTGSGAASGSGKGPIVCYRCGGPHLAPECKFKEVFCKFCKKKGHLAKVCRAKLQKDDASQPGQKLNLVEEHSEESDPENSNCYSMFAIRSTRVDPITTDVCINSIPITMEVDTGASLSILCSNTYELIAQQYDISALEEATATLKTYTGGTIPVLGKVKVAVSCNNHDANLYVHVVQGSGPDLMGRDWLGLFNVSFGVNHLEQSSETTLSLQSVLDKHAALFDGTLGCMKDVEVDLHIKPEAKPKFFKPRPVPYHLKQKTEDELQRLENLGVISPVKTSKWAAPIVPLVKKTGDVRMCVNFKPLNQDCDIDCYPLPRIEEIFANLKGGKLFSKLDLENAYFQIPLAESSKEFATINTHKGLFRFNRLPFGVASAPAIFQRTMETLLRGIKGVSVFIDDILVTGATVAEHLETLERVMARLEEAGLRLKREKCFFLRDRIEYLGHIIDAQGLHPTEEKIQAVKNAPQPKNVAELRSFLGILNYYGKFLPNLSSKLAPLYRLLHKQTKWSWGREQEKAFTEAKNALQADALLVHFDPNKPLIVEADASQYGIGAVLSHKMQDGQERPIAFASRTLNPAEKKYSQLEKEGLAIVFAVTKFHFYLYGQQFTIRSDHQPLSFLFSESKGIPLMASSRIQRWALTLSAYKYSISYKAGKSLQNADALSRLPLPVTSNHDGLPGDVVHLIDHLSTTTISCANIKKWTDKDPTLSMVRQYVLQGFPSTTLDISFTPYKSRVSELSVIDGCIVWGARVVVPPQGRQLVLDELHDTHPGDSRMKSLARCYIWWPNMNTEIEELVKHCNACQESRPSPPAAPLHPWEWPSKPWSRLHLDFAGPFLGHSYLILVDAYSKWLDVHIMNSTTSAKTIEKLRMVFSVHGLPHKIVTDNGTAFTSNEFRQFMAQNGIKHVTSAPYHPSSNGQAERAVQTFKRAMERMGDIPIQERISKFLFSYRLTPHTTTGTSPAELLMGYRPRSLLDNLRPDISQRVEHKQAMQKQSHDSSKPLRTFSVGDKVFVQNFSGTLPKWLSGTIGEVTGPLSYVVTLSDGRTVRRHVDAVRGRTVSDPPAVEPPSPAAALSVPLSTPSQPSPPAVPPQPVTTDTPVIPAHTQDTQPSVPQPRRSQRPRKPRVFFEGT